MVANDKKGFPFKVNGVELFSDDPILSARTVLGIARAGGAIPQEPDKYTLKGEKKEYRADDEVDLRQDNLFIAIPTGPTPVAMA